MITIDQLLESVDLDFEPRWVTKDGNGDVYIFEDIPETYEPSKQWVTTVYASGLAGYEGLKLAEFENKNWTECLYEVPRKTTGKIERLSEFDRTEASIFHAERLYSVVNELVDAVNELKAKFTMPTLNPDLTDEDLRKMMCDPKYWRDKDPVITQKVQNGFNKLYGDKN